MPDPYYADDTVTLWHGKNLDVLPHLADGSVDCVVTSPPYFGLRDYGVEGQYGAEETPAEFVANLVATFAEIRRVLAKDGTVWLNLGDSYAQSGKSGPQGATGQRADRKFTAVGVGATGLPAKNLLGMPWRTAFALQDDGWILRNAIVWHKPNAMPESVTDRLSTRYEMLFMFSKSRRYWFDLDPTRNDQQRNSAGTGYADGINPDGRNPGDVWEIPTVPFPGSHFAVFPPEIPRRCILAGCKPGGTVLDPFHGSGTTGMVAQRLGRKYVGIELKAEYIDLSLRTRLADGTLDFGT
jgi:site-specific DNA-methyltransferase (cytosine-N4-specific)